MRLGETDLEVVLAGITLRVDAIVNAANAGPAGGGGVDGAIHRAAGPRLREACRAIGACLTSDVRLAAGSDLPARHVIHAVGPVWRGGGNGEEKPLASGYRRAVETARSFESLAFSAISIGVYGFPAAEAARVTVGSTKASLAAAPTGVRRVTSSAHLRAALHNA